MSKAFTKESDIFAEHGVSYIDPILNLQDKNICAEQMLKAWGPILGLSREENERAIAAGFKALDIGYAAAYSWLMLVVVVLCSTIILRLLMKKGDFA